MNADRDRSRSGAQRGEGRASPAATLAAYLEKKGLKHSRQRDAIAETFHAMRGHVSVEELAARVRERDPHVSLATVYRTMKLLAECGLAAARQFGDGQTRYESAAGKAHHDHLICTSCGAIVEFADDEIEVLQAEVARRHGFDVESHKLELYGRCARCQGARNRRPARQEVAP